MCVVSYIFLIKRFYCRHLRLNIDRWQSLNVRTLDIRDRLEETGTEWRQLLMDLQEIIDWIARADQELTLQQPIGGDLEGVQNQNEIHQVMIINLCTFRASPLANSKSYRLREYEYLNQSGCRIFISILVEFY